MPTSQATTPRSRRPPSAACGLFIGKAACVDCHSGPTFSDQKFHNTGVPQIGATIPRVDNGRYDDLQKTLSNTWNGAGRYSDDATAGASKLAGMTLDGNLRGLFRTSALRHIGASGPYMHTGNLMTLEAVVQFYNAGGGVADYAGVKSAAMAPAAAQ